MAETVAILCLSVLLIAVLACWLYEAREHRKERAQLLDRIQAPQSFEVAAMERAIADLPPVEPPPDLFTERVHESEDIRLRTLFQED